MGRELFKDRGPPKDDGFLKDRKLFMGKGFFKAKCP